MLTKYVLLSIIVLRQSISKITFFIILNYVYFMKNNKFTIQFEFKKLVYFHNNICSIGIITKLAILKTFIELCYNNTTEIRSNYNF